jgi:hypothetical protein
MRRGKGGTREASNALVVFQLLFVLLEQLLFLTDVEVQLFVGV